MPGKLDQFLMLRKFLWHWAAFLTVLAFSSAIADARFPHGNGQYYGFVAQGASVDLQADTTNKQIMSRSPMLATDNLTSISLVFQNVILGNSGNGSAATQTASIEYPSGTIIGIVKFSSSASGTIPSTSVLQSDFVTLTSTIPKGSEFWVRSYYTNSSGVFYINVQSSGHGEQFAWAASGLTDQTGCSSGSPPCASTGSITGGTSQAFGNHPLAVIGLTSQASVCIVGDSRTVGLNTLILTSNNLQGGGNIATTLATNYANGPAYVDIAVGGEQANTWIAATPAYNTILPYCSQVIIALGINDVDAGRTGAQIATDIKAIAALATSARYKYVTTIEPRTSSSNLWTSPNDQVDTACTAHTPPCGSPDERVNYNTLVRAGLGGGITGYYDLASATESSLNSTFWPVSPSPPYTGDGLHESTAGYNLILNSGVVVPAPYP